ncbi:Uncharacterised protein [Klebsiella quasipneumoniae]|uniref:Uncharacterized protein n=1 Tax=Klebsiella quasipneumoniae TaxID=1463165 RepID=A0ABD7N7V9_9ENTR|nr:Uncharacterised protein [Klebsiella quasipneumoniae]SSG97723.1 Uncharacterised protein [Klebsiella quasipneumoniae]
MKLKIQDLRLFNLVFEPTFRTRFMNKSAGIEGRERR